MLTMKIKYLLKYILLLCLASATCSQIFNHDYTNNDTFLNSRVFGEMILINRTGQLFSPENSCVRFDQNIFFYFYNQV